MGGAPAPAAKPKERRLTKLETQLSSNLKSSCCRPEICNGEVGLARFLAVFKISTPSGAGDRTHGGTETRMTQTPNRTLAVLVFHFLYRIISDHNKPDQP